jgi:hypothetical protein
MSTITFEVREDGRDYWTRYTEVSLETEDYADFEEMKQAAYDMVADGEVDLGDKDYGEEDVDERELTDHDYDEDEEHEWSDPSKATVEPHSESSIEW